MRTSMVYLSCLSLLFLAITADGMVSRRQARSAGSVSTICPGSTCAMPASLVTDEQARDIVDAHNRLRISTNAVAMRKMHYNETLAERAQALADKCKIAHEDTCLCNGKPLGQNLFVNIGKDKYESQGVTKYVEHWFNEIADFDLQNNKCKDGKICGHFRQVAWKDTHQIGCGIRRCMKGEDYREVFVCDYYPPGNNPAIAPYAVGALPCSKCDQLDYAPTHAYKCSDDGKLCDGCQPGSAGCKSACKDKSAESCGMMIQFGGGCDGPMTSMLAAECAMSCKKC